RAIAKVVIANDSLHSAGLQVCTETSVRVAVQPVELYHLAPGFEIHLVGAGRVGKTVVVEVIALPQDIEVGRTPSARSVPCRVHTVAAVIEIISSEDEVVTLIDAQASRS